MYSIKVHLEQIKIFNYVAIIRELTHDNHAISCD